MPSDLSMPMGRQNPYTSSRLVARLAKWLHHNQSEMLRPLKGKSWREVQSLRHLLLAILSNMN